MARAAITVYAQGHGRTLNESAPKKIFYIEERIWNAGKVDLERWFGKIQWRAKKRPIKLGKEMLHYDR